jgi:pimeloyl-ACP methyl ester carboxylesterase
MKRRIADLFMAMGLSVLKQTSQDGKHIISEEVARDRFTNYRSRFLQIGDKEIHYRDEGSGVPLIMLHGFGASLHVWDPWVKLLSPDFRLIRLDLPGLGLSSPFGKGETVSIEFYTNFLREFLDRMGISRCHLVGNSFGGWLAWEFASLFPQRVDRMVLLSPAGFFTEGTRPRIAQIAQNPSFSRLLQTGLPRLLIKRIFQHSYYDRTKLSKESVDRQYGIINREGMLGSIFCIANTKVEIQTEKLAGLHIPTLIMWGEKDKVIHVADARSFHQAIPGSRLIIYEKVGHVPMNEIPERSTADLRKFLMENHGTT